MLTILSEVTPKELTQLKLRRAHKPIEQHYGIILRGERIAKRICIDTLKTDLKIRGIDKSRWAIMRWERGFSSPSISVIALWADCIGLKMSVFLDAPDRRLVKGTWVEKLKALRKDCDISREKINKQIGVNPWMITLWERGAKSPTESELKTWAQSLGATACLVFERV